MNTTISCDSLAADRFRAIRAGQQAMWASGDYAVIGATLQIVGELLDEAAEVRAVHRVLDVAAGSGNATPRGRAAVRRRHLHRLRAGAARTRMTAGRR